MQTHMRMALLRKVCEVLTKCRLHVHPLSEVYAVSHGWKGVEVHANERAEEGFGNKDDFKAEPQPSVH